MRETKKGMRGRGRSSFGVQRRERGEEEGERKRKRTVRGDAREERGPSGGKEGGERKHKRTVREGARKESR